MIASLTGVLQQVADDHVIVAVGGVGFQVFLPPGAPESLAAVGNEVTLHTSLLIRDEVPLLYGFPTREGKRLFEALMEVNGVGPRHALAMLSVMTPDEAAVAIVSGNVDTISAVHGIGKRTAGRIVIDLQAKLQKEWEATGVAAPAADSEVVAALQALGYTSAEAQGAVSALGEPGDLPLEEQVRLALQHLARE